MYNKNMDNFSQPQQPRRVQPLQRAPQPQPQPTQPPQPSAKAEEPSISFSDGPSQVGAKDHKPLIAGIICLILGIILGGVGIFCFFKFVKQPTECPQCDCAKSNEPISPEVNLSFLKLENNSNNMLYSPLSIRYGLSLLSSGASGETATEIENVLGDTEIPTYQNEADTLSLANAVFINNSFKDSVLPEYISTVESQYNSEVIYDSFDSSSTMDNWVDQKTFGLIKSIGLDVDSKVEMVLANALAIQMPWQDGFNEVGTNDDPFYYENNEEEDVETMHKSTSDEDIKYTVNDEITVLSMPLAKTEAGVQLEFDAIMPANSLSSYIENLNLDDINTILDNTTSASTQDDGIEISIPKFKFDYKLNFEDDLKSLGINSAFKDNADFSKMASESLYVSEASHLATIEFSEGGIKAAAVTSFSMMDTALAPSTPLEVTINHPFLFLIRDKSNGAIWFIGTVYQPSFEESSSTSE